MSTRLTCVRRIYGPNDAFEAPVVVRSHFRFWLTVLKKYFGGRIAQQ